MYKQTLNHQIMQQIRGVKKNQKFTILQLLCAKNEKKNQNI